MAISTSAMVPWKRCCSESLNLASQLRVPAIFVVGNNLFTSHMHMSLRQPSIRRRVLPMPMRSGTRSLTVTTWAPSVMLLVN